MTFVTIRERRSLIDCERRSVTMLVTSVVLAPIAWTRFEKMATGVTLLTDNERGTLEKITNNAVFLDAVALHKTGTRLPATLYWRVRQLCKMATHRERERLL